MYINRLSDYLKNEFGEKLYRISLNGGMTCPNRDGTCGSRGCIFCSEKGSGEFTPDFRLGISEQIEIAKAIVSNKSKSDRYIAYFQAFSNTYAPPEYLRSLYTDVILREDIAVLSIATRPDCIDEEVAALLGELNRIKPVWVELGLQTMHSDTAGYIRRGYGNECYEKAVELLKTADCKVITHIILGLPLENKSDMIKTAEYVGRVSDGVKFHTLYISKGTDIAEDYNNGKFEILSEDEYIDILCECVRVLPRSTVIHRLTGDGDRNTLIAPLWTINKKRVLRNIDNAFTDRDVNQGENLTK